MRSKALLVAHLARSCLAAMIVASAPTRASADEAAPTRPASDPAGDDRKPQENPPEMPEGDPEGPRVRGAGQTIAEKRLPTSTGDGVYGRIEGDLTFVVGAGLTFGPRAPRLAGELRLRYLDTVGAFAAYEEGGFSDSAPVRAVITGFEVRPLFLGRWLKGMQSGVARKDLFIDSIGFELGAIFAQGAGSSFSQRPGLHASLGVEFPILPQATGPWLALRGGLRWSDTALAEGRVQSAEDRTAFLTLTVAFHQVFGGHVVDVGDRPVR